MRVLVTGGAGFIGSHLTELLVTEGHEVAVLDDLSTGRFANLARVRGRIAFEAGDVCDPERVARLADGVEVIFHQAALASVERSLADPRAATAVNFGGTLNVLEAARAQGVRRVVFASSSSVYGDSEALPKHEDLPVAPLSPYAASKAAAEAMLRAYHASFGIECVSLRYFNVYGPRQDPEGPYAAVIPKFMTACLAGDPLRIQGDGLQTRDFTFVADVARAVLAAAHAPDPLADPINIGAGVSVSILELAHAVAAACGREASIEHEAPRAGDVRDSLADVTRAKERLGWSAETSLADGLARLFAAPAASGE